MSIYRAKIKAIASSASNTWGLFLLVLLLGYALVEVPRNLWNTSKPEYMLQYSYFKVAKLSFDKAEAEEAVDDVLEVGVQLYLKFIQVTENILLFCILSCSLFKQFHWWSLPRIPCNKMLKQLC